MFYEVRIYTPNRNLKEIVSSEQLSKRHWQAFEKNQIIRKTLEERFTNITAKQA